MNNTTRFRAPPLTPNEEFEYNYWLENSSPELSVVYDLVFKHFKDLYFLDKNSEQLFYRFIYAKSREQ
jgi:hypothetical protein